MISKDFDVMNNPADKLAAAIRYCELGIPVLLLTPGAKEPLPGSHGCKDATTDASKIVELWGDKPSDYYNIGCATGVVSDGVLNLFVIDDDSAKAGVPSFIETSGFKRKLATTWTTVTAHGGNHYIYLNADDKDFKNKVRKSINTDIRANGGFIVLPPSTLSDCDKPYRWVYGLNPGSRDAYNVDDDVERFYDLVSDSDTNKGTKHYRGSKTYSDNSSNYDTDNWTPYKIPDVIDHGERNSELYRIAASFCGSGFPADMISGFCHDLNENGLFNPALVWSEIERTVDSAINGHIDRGGSVKGQWVKGGNSAPDTLVQFINKLLYKGVDVNLIFDWSIRFNELYLKNHFEEDNIARLINRQVKYLNVNTLQLAC